MVHPEVQSCAQTTLLSQAPPHLLCLPRPPPPAHDVTASGYSCACASFPGQRGGGGLVTFQEVSDPATLPREQLLQLISPTSQEGLD